MASERASQHAFLGISALLFGASAALTIAWCTSIVGDRRDADAGRLDDVDGVDVDARTDVITGIATNVCPETTAREAAVRDFRVFFISDGTSTVDINGVPRDVLKKATCAVLGTAFAQVLTVDQMIDKLSPP